MADIVLDVEAAPSTPSAGAAIIYVDSTTKLPSSVNDAGLVQTTPWVKTNSNTASQGGASGFQSDTYVTGSSIALGAHVPRVGGTYYCRIDLAKDANGVATPIAIVRFGTAGAVGDTARLTFTFNAGTGATDVGYIEITAVFRTVGSGTSAVLQGQAAFFHSLSTTGLINTPSQVLQVTSGGFDSTVANSFIGVSLNGGAAINLTAQLVESSYTSSR